MLLLRNALHLQVTPTSAGKELFRSKSIDVYLVIEQFIVTVCSFSFRTVANRNNALNAVFFGYPQNSLDVIFRFNCVEPQQK